MGDVQNFDVQNIAARRAKELLSKMHCPVNLIEKLRVQVLDKYDSDSKTAHLNALTLSGASSPACVILFEVKPSRRFSTLHCQLLLVNDLRAPHVARQFIDHCILKHTADRVGRVEVKVIYHDPTLTFWPRPYPLS